MANNTSQHILNTAANLLGFCLFVTTSFHVAAKSDSSNIDELASAVALLLVLSCFLSFFSIKTKNESKKQRLERYAEYLFAASLTGILIIILNAY